MNITVLLKKRGYSISCKEKSNLPSAIFPYVVVQCDEDSNFSFIATSKGLAEGEYYLCEDAETGATFLKEKVEYLGVFSDVDSAISAIDACWSSVSAGGSSRLQVFSVANGLTQLEKSYKVTSGELLESQDDPIDISAEFCRKPVFEPSEIVVQSISEGLNPKVHREERFPTAPEEVDLSGMGLGYRPSPLIFTWTCSDLVPQTIG